MSWWGGGADKGNQDSSKDFTSSDESSFSTGSNMMSSGGGGLGGSGGSGMAELQQMSMAIQQQMLVQQAINDLSDRSYEKCVTSRPSDQLSGSQAACIKSTVNKWLDTNEFMTGRLAKKAQQSQGIH